MWTTSTGMAFSLTRVPALGKGGGAIFPATVARAPKLVLLSAKTKTGRHEAGPSCAIRRLQGLVTRDRDSAVCLVELDIDDAHLAFGIFDFVDALLFLLDRLVAAAAERAQSLLDL